MTYRCRDLLVQSTTTVGSYNSLEPPVSYWADRVRRVLVSTHDRGIDEDVTVDLVGGVGLGEQGGQDCVLGAVGGVAAVAFLDRCQGPNCSRGRSRQAMLVR